MKTGYTKHFFSAFVMLGLLSGGLHAEWPTALYSGQQPWNYQIDKLAPVGKDGVQLVAGIVSGSPINFGEISIPNTNGVTSVFGLIDAHGEWIWVKSLSGQARRGNVWEPTLMRIQKVVSDSSNNIYMLGRFLGRIQIGEHILEMRDVEVDTGDDFLANEGFFVAKFNFEGGVEWAKLINNRIDSFNEFENLVIHEEVADNNDKRVQVYVTGKVSRHPDNPNPSQYLDSTGFFLYDGASGNRLGLLLTYHGSIPRISDIFVSDDWIYLAFNTYSRLDLRNDLGADYHIDNSTFRTALIRFERRRFPNAVIGSPAVLLDQDFLRNLVETRLGNRVLFLNRDSVGQVFYDNSGGNHSDPVHILGRYTRLHEFTPNPGGVVNSTYLHVDHQDNYSLVDSGPSDSVFRPYRMRKFNAQNQEIFSKIQPGLTAVYALNMDDFGRVYCIDNKGGSWVIPLTPEFELEPLPVVLGGEVPLPPTANLNARPVQVRFYNNQGDDASAAFRIIDNETGFRVLALAPGFYTLEWPALNPRDPSSLRGLKQSIKVAFPDNPILHVAGCPVNIHPVGTDGEPSEYTYLDLVLRHESTPIPDNGIFQATETGRDNPEDAYSVMLFKKGEDVIARVIRTINWWDAPQATSMETTIGAPIIAPAGFHNDPSSLSGFVVNPNAPFDGAGLNRAHDRDQRLGPIVPVNTSDISPGEPIRKPQDPDADAGEPEFYEFEGKPVHTNDLVVVYYQRDDEINLAWPQIPVRFEPKWPEDQTQLLQSELTPFHPQPLDIPGLARVADFQQTDSGAPVWIDGETGDIHVVTTAQNVARVTGPAGRLFLSGNRVFWSEPQRGRVMQVATAGGPASPLLAHHPLARPLALAGGDGYLFIGDLEKHRILRAREEGNGRADSLAFASFVNSRLPDLNLQVTEQNTHTEPSRIPTDQARQLIRQHGPALIDLLTPIARDETDSFLRQARENPTFLQSRFQIWTDEQASNGELVALHFSHDEQGNGRIVFLISTTPPIGGDPSFDTYQVLLDGVQTIVAGEQLTPHDFAYDAVTQRLFWIDHHHAAIQSAANDGSDLRLHIQSESYLESLAVEPGPEGRLVWSEWTEDERGQIVSANRDGSMRMVRRNEIQSPSSLSFHQGRLTWREGGLDLIVIASQQGSEFGSQARFSSDRFEDVHIYHQANRNLPGFNPNNEHALSAPSNRGTSHLAVFALRSDLTDTSEPFVLVKYRRPQNPEWQFKTYRVLPRGFGFDFTFVGEAGQPFFAPYPLRDLIQNACQESLPSQPWQTPYWRDYNDQEWAISAGSLSRQYFYPLIDSFYWDESAPDTYAGRIGDCVPWLDGIADVSGTPGTRGTPLNYRFEFSWPRNTPLLPIGETLTLPTNNLPNIANQASVQVVLESRDDGFSNEPFSLVRLADYGSPVTVALSDVGLEELPAEIVVYPNAGSQQLIVGNRDETIKLPTSLHRRLRIVDDRLVFGGVLKEQPIGAPWVLPNVMTQAERDLLKSLSQNGRFHQLIDLLYVRSRDPGNVRSSPYALPDYVAPDTDYLVGIGEGDGRLAPRSIVNQGFESSILALISSKANGSGYVTLAFNNDPVIAGAENSPPIALKILRVDCLPGPSAYLGQVQVIDSGQLFDDQLTLRHSGDFGGAPENLHFQWFLHRSGQADIVPPTFNADGGIANLNGWFPYDGNQAGTIGQSEITIGGSNPATLADHYVFVRYRGLGQCAATNPYTAITGAAGSSVLEPYPALAEGWIKRTTRNLGPFNERVSDFRQTNGSSLSSMISLIGERYEGDIAFSNDSEYAKQIGLVEAFETVLRRGIGLSLHAGVEDAAINQALLLAAGKLSDLYVLLGNEAKADAADPTIGFDTQSSLGAEASALWTFRDQTASPLDEELALLIGRDGSQTNTAAAPIYNRIPWNFASDLGRTLYVQTYNIQPDISDDDDADTTIDEEDARTRFPQGHGDAWGHYLYALKVYYMLLRHPAYTWIPLPEQVVVGGQPIDVDFQDERRFAAAAVAKARIGSEAVDLVYRKRYVEDPAGQWQGYRDTTMVKVPVAGASPSQEPSQARAWGVDGWARRATQGAVFDWITGNSLLPAENQEDEGLRKIDRTTVPDLSELAAQASALQHKLDEIDNGLNPLGLAKGVVPFDLNPELLTFRDPKTHFEQVYGRAIKVLSNARKVFDRANNLTQMLRHQQDTEQQFKLNVLQQELDYKNRLIELFGYPYDGDIGPGKTYGASYDGPDLLHFSYVERPPALGTDLPEFTHTSRTLRIPAELDFHAPSVVTDPQSEQRINQIVEIEVDFWQAAGGQDIVTTPPGFGSRRAIGEIQRKLSNALVLQAEFRHFVARYLNHQELITDKVELLEAHYNLAQEDIAIKYANRDQTIGFNTTTVLLRSAKLRLEQIAQKIRSTTEQVAESHPTVNGFSNDMTSAIRASIRAAGRSLSRPFNTAAFLTDIHVLRLEHARDVLRLQNEIEILINATDYETLQQSRELEQLMREELVMRIEGLTMLENIRRAFLDYRAAVAEGERLVEQWVVFRKRSAATTQSYRYKDLAYRIFRNDTLRKYHSQFNLASRYVFLTAAAYDYDTNLLDHHQDSGRDFLAKIVRQRGIGEIGSDGPVVGSGGLAGILADLNNRYLTYKSQMGFNNPQFEVRPFSLRRELFRISEQPEGDLAWEATLRRFRVPDLWDIPEFNRFCRPFNERQAGPQPGIVIPFSTKVESGLNFFGWPLAAGDSSYDASQFSTRIRSAGVWLSGFRNLPVAYTARAYLVPVGMDILRSPYSQDFSKRAWRVHDQVLAEPFDINGVDLADDDWFPIQNTLESGAFTNRTFPQTAVFDDLHDGYVPGDMHENSRLVGRSVANDRWLLIIPGESLRGDADRGLDLLIGDRTHETQPYPGIADIKISFSTYAYQGIGFGSEQQKTNEQPKPRSGQGDVSQREPQKTAATVSTVEEEQP